MNKWKIVALFLLSILAIIFFQNCGAINLQVTSKSSSASTPISLVEPEAPPISISPPPVTPPLTAPKVEVPDGFSVVTDQTSLPTPGRIRFDPLFYSGEIKSYQLPENFHLISCTSEGSMGAVPPDIEITISNIPGDISYGLNYKTKEYTQRQGQVREHKPCHNLSSPDSSGLSATSNSGENDPRFFQNVILRKIKVLGS